MKKLVGKVSIEEKNEIENLFNRKNALKSLIESIDLNDSKKKTVYKSLISDYQECETNFQKWWQIASEKYKWESKKDNKWEINFETCEIYLVD